MDGEVVLNFTLLLMSGLVLIETFASQVYKLQVLCCT